MQFFYVLIFAYQKRVGSKNFELLYLVEVGDQARYLCFWSFYKFFGVFITIIGGTPYKRVPEGLF